MKVLFLNSINSTIISDGRNLTFVGPKEPLGISLDEVPQDVFKELTETEINAAWNTFKIDLNQQEDKPQFAEESFIKSVDDAYNTGGNILNDIITLKNGMIIQISEEGICLYKNEDDQENGNTILWYDEGTDNCWCRSCKKG